MTERVRRAAVSYVEREDGRILCVWNKRYEGWSMPGGMVEPTDASIEAAQERELREETGLGTVTRELMFEGVHGIQAVEGRGRDRASYVHVFRVTTRGEPRKMEAGCPVTWLTRAEFLERSPFAPLYATVFAQCAPAVALARKAYVTPVVKPLSREKGDALFERAAREEQNEG